MTNFVRADDAKSLLIVAKGGDFTAPVAEIPYADIKRIKIRATQWRRFLIVERQNVRPLSFPVPEDAEDTVAALDALLRKNDDYRLYNEQQDRKHERAVLLFITVTALFAPLGFAVLLLLPAVAGWSVFAALSVVLILSAVSVAKT